MLKICSDNLLFNITHTNYVYIVCIFAIFLCILVFLLLYNKNCITIKITDKVKNIIILSISIILLITTYTLLLYNYNGCTCEYSNLNIKTSSNEVKNISNNKIIVIGDSRMALIEEEKQIYNIPINLSFIASSGKRIGWTEDVAIPLLEKKLRDDNYIYHVVINMGVNDVQIPRGTLNKTIDDYNKLYKSLALKYLKDYFYIMSVNPINSEKMKIYEPTNVRKEYMVEHFNDRLIDFINETNLENLNYCDAYHDIYFHTMDGLHYTRETNQDVIDYIVKDCVKY